MSAGSPPHGHVTLMIPPPVLSGEDKVVRNHQGVTARSPWNGGAVGGREGEGGGYCMEG
jgi:hypothetical protein